MFLYSHRISLPLVMPLLLGSLLVARPAYSIPTTLEEGQQWIGELCADFGIDFCAYVPQEDEADAKKPLRLTATERQVLTRLVEQQKNLERRGRDLDRRETQLQALTGPQTAAWDAVTQVDAVFSNAYCAPLQDNRTSRRDLVGHIAPSMVANGNSSKPGMERHVPTSPNERINEQKNGRTNWSQTEHCTLNSGF